MLQFISSGLLKMAVPSTIHCDYLIQVLLCFCLRGKEESKERRESEWVEDNEEKVKLLGPRRKEERRKVRKGGRGRGWKIAWRKCSC
jgi:hypothetical protein